MMELSFPFYFISLQVPLSVQIGSGLKCLVNMILSFLLDRFGLRPRLFGAFDNCWTLNIEFFIWTTVCWKCLVLIDKSLVNHDVTIKLMFLATWAVVFFFVGIRGFEVKSSRFLHSPLFFSHRLILLLLLLFLSLSHSCLPIFRGLVMLIHGLAEHLGCYDELGCRLATENFLAFGHDHGKPIFFCFLVSSQFFLLLNTVSNDSDQTWLVVLEEVDYVTFSLEFIRSNQHQLQFWKNQYHQCCWRSFYFNCLFFNFL